MSKVLLPEIKEDKILPVDHFPTRMHAAVFRLWETVRAEQIAKGLDIPLNVILKAAEDMGLKEQKNMEKWPDRGYITTIRNIWNLIPYEQLLKVLDWDEERLAQALKDDDFLLSKVGFMKPYCEQICEEELNEKQIEQLARIKAVMQDELEDMFAGAKPFDFFDESIKVGAPCNDMEDLRMVYSYCGLYANVLDEDISISYPEKMLEMYQASGINAIWLPVILYQVTPFPFDESYSKGWEKRLERLGQIIKLAEKYNIKVYLYLNEPRSLPLAFFEKYPELKGREKGPVAAMCMSDPRVLDYLKNAVKTLCEAVPDIGGFFAITLSENLTHCKSRMEGIPCERCEDTPTSKFVSDVLRTISETSRAVNPNIRTIAWTWAWELMMSDEEILDCIKRLPKEIIIQSNSEAKKKFVIGGVEGEIADYSISIPGPSELARNVWNTARENGHEVSAKVQVNVSWECSTMPYLPVFDLIREHMTNLHNEGVKHMMMSWTLGGYPSINMKIASQTLSDPSEETYDKILMEEYGENAPIVKKAAKIFSEAFREFPFHIRNLYTGPQNPGPSNLLYEKPTGFTATMTCFTLDDLDTWRGAHYSFVYPKEVYREQLRKLSEIWREGLKVIEDMPDCEFKHMAYGGYALFYSSYLQTDFIMNREGTDKERILDILEEERKTAVLMYELMNKNAYIGFEAANHYYFNKGMLAEKVICCDYLKEVFSKK